MDQKISELREKCIEQGLNFLDELVKLKAKPKTPEPKVIAKEPPKKGEVTFEVEIGGRGKKEVVLPEPKPKSPRTIVSDILRKPRREATSLDSIVEEVRTEFTRLGIDYADTEQSVVSYKVCPLKGYVAWVAYENAREKSNVPVTEKNFSEIRAKGKKGSKRKKSNPPPFQFNEEDTLHIVGKLSKEYVLENYSLSEDALEFVFTEMPERACNIEGSNSWSGYEKAESRRIISEFIYSHLMLERKERREEIDTRLKEINRRLTSLAMRPPQERRKKHVGYEISARSARPLEVFRQISGGTYYRDLRTISGANIGADPDKITISWSTPEAKREIKSIISKIRTDRNRRGGYLKGLNVESIKESKEDKLKTEKATLRQERKELRHELDSLKRGRNLTYLGLEGPGLRSYIEFLSFVKSKEPYTTLTAVLPEYHCREANLMRSMLEAHLDGENDLGIGRDTEVVSGNVNDWIRLDCPFDEAITLKNSGRTVHYQAATGKKYRIPIGKYYELLDRVDKVEEQARTKKRSEVQDFRYKKLRYLSQRYKMPGAFIDSLNQRFDGTFDIVFLDYIGGTNAITEPVIKRLERRLSDNSVLAITTNLDRNKNVSTEPYDIIDKQLGPILDKVEDWSEPKIYNDGRPMMLMVYKIKK